MKYLLSLILALTVAGPVLAAGPQTLGPLAPHVDLDPNGAPWRLTEDGGMLVVENDSKPGVVTYYFVEPARRPLVASVRTTAEAGGAPGDLSGAGLLYALQGEVSARLYYVFLVQEDGTTSILRRDAEGIKPVITTRRDDLDTSRPIDLKVEESDNGATFYVNDEKAGTVQSRGIGSGAVGIAAVGTGRFTFQNFQLGAATRN